MLERRGNRSESGRGAFFAPPGSSPLPDLQLQNQYRGETERKYPMHPLIQLKRATPVFFVALGFVWLGLLPKAQAVSPAPDGGYPNNNTAEGDNALNSLTTGSNNTATGFDALFNNTRGNNNTAGGFNAILHNQTGNNNLPPVSKRSIKTQVAPTTPLPALMR
jgi:hypothetical protein